MRYKKPEKQPNELFKDIRHELSAILKTVDVGYPYFGVPQSLRRTLRLIKELENKVLYTKEKEKDNDRS